ncbi:MAG: 4Fe-4S binding protein [Candidatus Omnitrophica bacterium]|nr:4Fe-4S binding protein [Candidatus Omnitrophota bacterium]
MKLRYLSGVVTLKYDVNKCKGCASCIEVCPHGVFSMEAGKARMVDKDSCIECGACMKNCPFDAISVDAGVGCAAAILASKGTGKAVCCGSEGGCC